MKRRLRVPSTLQNWLASGQTCQTESSGISHGNLISHTKPTFRIIFSQPHFHETVQAQI